MSNQAQHNSASDRNDLLQLHLCGGFYATLEGNELTIANKKGQALLAMLSVSLTGRETREFLRGTLWSESSEKRAQYSLRNTIWTLNAVFEKAEFKGFEATREQVLLNLSRVSTDIRQIRDTLDTTEPDSRLCENARIFESMLYGFEGLDQAFDEWLQVARESLQKEAIRKLEEVLQTPDLDPASFLSVAKVLVDYDGMNETACQALIRAYHSTGAIANALSVYQSLWDLLDAAYGEEPSATTQDLIVAIKSETTEGISATNDNTPWNNHEAAVRDGAATGDAGGFAEEGGTQQRALPPSEAIAAALPEKPSLAVLAFNNLSADPDQEHFSDGITEDIITALSKFRWFFVIARNSSFAYKDAPIDIKQVGLDLGVGYVIQGSVRKSGKHVRISAQLLDASTGITIWAERYDRLLDDIFELQDEITQTIAAAAEPELAGFESERAVKKPTNDLQAWDLFHRGVREIWQMTRSGLEEGEKYMRQAITADRHFGQPHGYLAFHMFLQFLFGRTEDRDRLFERGMAHARTALFLDHRDYFAHFAMGRLYTMIGDHTSAINELAKSIVINPNFAHGYFGLASANVYAGKGNQALRFIDQAIKLSPNDPLMWVFLTYKGCACSLLDEYDDAIDCLERACHFAGAQYWAFAELAAAYVHADRMEEGARALAQARKLEPDLSLKLLRDPIRDMKYAHGEYTIENLRKLGLE